MQKNLSPQGEIFLSKAMDMDVVDAFKDVCLIMNIMAVNMDDHEHLRRKLLEIIKDPSVRYFAKDLAQYSYIDPQGAFQELTVLENIVKNRMDMTLEEGALSILVKYFDEHMPRLEKIVVGDWIDLRAREDVSISFLESGKIPLGVAMQLPEGYEAHIAPRSSTFKHWNIIQTNPPGIVDEKYCGDNDEWFFSAVAFKDTEIKKGDRIAQFRIVRKMPKVELIEVETLDNPDRGGYGSTGEN